MKDTLRRGIPACETGAMWGRRSRRDRRRSRTPIWALVLLVASSAAGQAPLGSELLVNNYTNIAQVDPVVAHDPSGNFVVAWASCCQEGGGTGVFARRFDSSGAPLGSEFLVNTYTTSTQASPAIASDVNGNVVVVWNSSGQNGPMGIFGQRYDSGGGPLGSEFQINTYTTGGQFEPAVDYDSSGNFVVVWNGTGQDGSSNGIIAQRFDSSGSAVGSELLVNTYTTGDQRGAAVASDASGNFVVVWQSDAQDGSSNGVFAQRFDSSGSAVGTEFPVNTYTTDDQRVPAVASDTSGTFVVVWESGADQDGSGYGVFGQRFDNAGIALGTEFQVNTYTTFNQRHPDVRGTAAGDFVVAWFGADATDITSGILGQLFDSAGTPVGSEFRLNAFTADVQEDPSIALDASGNFTVVWESYGQDGSSWGIVGRRFASGPLPADTPTATATIAPPTATPTSASAVCAPTPRGDCGAATKSLIKIADNNTNPLARKMIWKWTLGSASLADLGDPVNGTTNYAVCVYDDGGLQMSPWVGAGGTCGNNPCWAPFSTGMQYKERYGFSYGLTNIQIKPGAGTASIKVKGKGSNLAMPFPIVDATAVTVQLVRNPGAAVECWGATFPAPAGVNDGVSFKDKIP